MTVAATINETTKALAANMDWQNRLYRAGYIKIAVRPDDPPQFRAETYAVEDGASHVTISVQGSGNLMAIYGGEAHLIYDQDRGWLTVFENDRQHRSGRMDWQPIETAPRDGTAIELWWDGLAMIPIASWLETGWGLGESGEEVPFFTWVLHESFVSFPYWSNGETYQPGDDEDDAPTHWRPHKRPT